MLHGLADEVSSSLCRDSLEFRDIVGIADRDRLAEPAVLTDVRQARDESR
jgi:hypothetical protein